MDIRDLRALLDYHYWARDRMLDAVETLETESFLKDIGGSFGSLRDTAAHVYGAEWIWYARWRGDAPSPMPAPDLFPDAASLRNGWIAHEARVRAFVDGLGEEGIHRVIRYRTLDGAASAQPFWQTLQHVVNHASYHRGQVTTLLRQLGATPPKTMDLIAFYRERPF